ncbi:MAG: hypothetical protein PHU85_00540 [Phycisphaerae bacterium]|nr:hypothetical protein [Phycisphaerae bacterium]
MSRKGKGAALFELLYKDKGKATDGQGALKLPSWFRTKAQGTIASTQPAPVPASGAAPAEPKPAAPAAAPEAPAVKPAAAVKPEPPAAKPSVAESPAAPKPAELPLLAGAAPAKPVLAETVRPAPPEVAKPAPSAAPSAPSAASAAPSVRVPAAMPPRLVPPWAAGPWLQVEHGRFRLNITTFAAYVLGGAFLCVLLLTFFAGRASVRQKVAPAPAATPQPAAATIKDARDKPADPTLLRPSPTPVASPTEGAPEHGKYYVIIQTFKDNLDAANKVKNYFAKAGYPVVVAAPAGTTNYLVRTSQGLDKAGADKLAIELDGVLAKMSTELPGLVRYRPTDPTCKPMAKQY